MAARPIPAFVFGCGPRSRDDLGLELPDVEVLVDGLARTSPTSTNSPPNAMATTDGSSVAASRRVENRMRELSLFPQRRHRVVIGHAHRRAIGRMGEAHLAGLKLCAAPLRLPGRRSSGTAPPTPRDPRRQTPNFPAGPELGEVEVESGRGEQVQALGARRSTRTARDHELPQPPAECSCTAMRGTSPSSVRSSRRTASPPCPLLDGDHEWAANVFPNDSPAWRIRLLTAAWIDAGVTSPGEANLVVTAVEATALATSQRFAYPGDGAGLAALIVVAGRVGKLLRPTRYPHGPVVAHRGAARTHHGPARDAGR